MKTNHSARSARFLFLIASLVSTLAAQTAPGTDEAPKDALKDQTVVLSPFSVQADKDNGYQAADTLSAGRMATKLLSTPADISVLTADFLRDLGATNLTDIYNFLPNTFVNDAPVGNGNGRDTGSSVTIRGVPTSGNSRNYATGFPYSINAYLTERVEQVRGPASILYGTALSGGQINIITKRAGFHDFGTVGARIDGEGSKTATVDVNRKINDVAAVRVNMVDQGLRTWIPGYFDDLKAADIAATVRPWKGAELRVDAELGTRWKSDQPDPEGNNTDNTSALVAGTSVTGPVARAPAGTALIAATNPWVFSNSFGNQVQNFTGYVQSLGSAIPITWDGVQRDGINQYPSLPKRNFSQQPTNNALENHYYGVQTFFDQSWDNGFALEIGQSAAGIRRTGNGQPLFGNRYLDVETVLPNGSPNPEYLKPYSVQAVAGGNMHEFQNDLNFRANLIYRLKKSWFSQSFALIAQSDIAHLERRTYVYGKTSGGVNPTANEPAARVYWDQPNPNAALIFPTTDAAGDTFGWVNTAAALQSTRLDSVQFGTVGNYFDDKLTVIGGVRRDVYHFHEADPVLTNGYISSYTNNIYDDNANTASIGATYFPLKWIGVEVNYSNGFNPNSISAPFLAGAQYRPVTTNQVFSTGLRFNLWSGHLVGGVNYYQQKEANRLVSQSTSTIVQIWTAMGQTQNEPLGGGSAYTDSEAFAAQGVEADLVANVNNQVRFLFNIAFPKAYLTDALPDTHAYVNANLPVWNAAVAAGTPSVAAFLANELNAVNSLVNGREQNSNYDWKANVFGVYTLPYNGPFKGWRVGGGANAFGERLIGNQNGQPLAYIKARAYWVASGLIAYTFKVHNIGVDLQLNVSNLFNYTYPIFYNVAIAGSTGFDPTVVGQAFRADYDYIQPRTWSLSGTVRF